MDVMQFIVTCMSQTVMKTQLPLSDSLSPNQKRHFTFWKLSPKFGLGKRLIQKVKSPSVCVCGGTTVEHVDV